MGEPGSAPLLLSDATGDADVHAFLIADVRGWTRFTRERGDEDAARLAGRLAEVTRSVVEAHRGRVLELRGDEAMVVFGSPRSAIRAAVALQRRFVEETIADPSLPLTVGIGLDAGEAVPVEGGYRGGALNVAARLCSLARAGEVLASREIVHLALRVDGVRFTERGPSSVKGIDKPVHVVVVRSEDRDDAQAIAPFVRSSAPPPKSRWKAVAAVVAFALVAILVAVPLVTRDSGRDSEIDPNSIGILDAESGDVTATVGLEYRPGAVASSSEAVWVTNPDVGTVTQIDTTDQEIRDRIQVGENPTGIAVGEGAVWVLNSGGPSVSRISADTGEVFDPIPVGNGPAGIAVGEGSVWVTNRFDGTVSRIDPERGQVIKKIPVGFDPRGIAVGFNSVWVGLAGANSVVRIDPATNLVTHTVLVNAPGSLALSEDAVWVANSQDDTISRINPETNSVVNTVPVGDGPTGVAVVQGTVWVANEADGTLSRIEPDQTSSSSMVIGSVPQGLADVNGALWVSVRGTTTSHLGGTLRIVSSEDFSTLDTLDTRVAYTPDPWLLFHLIGDGLVAFEPIGGTSSSLVPDLAISLPTPTDGGRTYSFELRPEIPYSNGEIVAPTDFRRALEQGFPLSRSAHATLYSGLVGGEACVEKPPTCDLSEGIVTDDAGGRITFHLVAPDPEFLYKLALPFAYPVPPSVRDEEQVEAGIPGTGPYMLEAPMTEEGLALVRNPRFRAWSSTAQPDGYVDGIHWTFAVEPSAQVEAVTTGEADLTFEAVATDRLAIRYAAQLHTTPIARTYFGVLDNEVPPFDNAMARQAVNLALDRERVVRIFGGAALPTCQQLPPNFPGYEPYCPYTADARPDGRGSWTAPDFQKAQRLVIRSGTAGMPVTFRYVSWLPRELGNYMVELLRDLGYQVSVWSPERGSSNPSNKPQMHLGGWGADYPAASNFIQSMFSCDATIYDSGFCDPRIDEMIDHALEVQTQDAAAAGALWAEIDRAIVDEAPIQWIANPLDVELVSERVGNYQFGNQWGVLLNQLWVR